MRSFTHSLIGAGLALLLTASAHAQTFQYSTTTPLGPQGVPNGGSILFTGNTGATATCDQATGGTDIVLANITVLADPTAANTPINVPYTITLGIDGSSYPIDFTLGGTLGPGAANTTNTLNAGLPLFFTSNNVNYEVTINPFTPPGPQSSQTLGAVGAHVICNAQPAVPEPSTLALLGTGLLPLVGLVRRRK